MMFFGLYVPVHDTHAVRMCESVQDLLEDPGRVRGRQPSLRVKRSRKVSPRRRASHSTAKLGPIPSWRGISPESMRVRMWGAAGERRWRDFAQEPFGAQRGSHFGMEDLDGDGAIVLDVVREKHGRHAAAAHLALELVGATESLLDNLATSGTLSCRKRGGDASQYYGEGGVRARPTCVAPRTCSSST